MNIDDQYIVSAGVTVWGATASIVAVLWKRTRELERIVAKLHSEKSDGAAAMIQLEQCPSPSCPYKGMFLTFVAVLFLAGCAAAPVPQTFDKRVLIVFRDETPKSFTASIAGLIQPFTKLILP